MGGGLGFAALSPWPGHRASPTTFTVTAAIWMIVTQWLSAALGGYVAGRLRTRWVGTHTHEVFFRDTAHGLVTWSVATVAVALVFAGSLASLVGVGVRAGLEGSHSAPLSLPQPPAAGASTGALGAALGPASPMMYGIDRLFRPAGVSASARSAAEGDDPRFEAAHILANALATGRIPEGDRAYLAELVAAHAGISGAEAQRRVDDFIAAARAADNDARAAADAARKTAEETSIYTALSMLVGAFIASVAAALGGRLRDLHP